MIQHTTNTIWVGLDVHSASITAAILHGDSPDPEIVRLPGDLNATRRLFRKLSAKGVPRACYEASGAGYVLQRSLDRGTTWENVSGYLIASATWSDTFHNRAEYRVLAEDTAANQSAYSNQALWVVTTGGGKYATDSAQPIL